MTTSVRPSTAIAPTEVREVLSRHMLVDGYHLVQDIERSHGVWLHDAVRGRDVLDFFGHFSTSPIGFNHPKATTEEFKARKHRPSTREIFRSILANWGLVIAGMMMVAMTTVSFYLITVYTPTFGKSVLHLSTTDALVVTLCVAVWRPGRSSAR